MGGPPAEAEGELAEEAEPSEEPLLIDEAELREELSSPLRRVSCARSRTSFSVSAMMLVMSASLNTGMGGFP